MVPPSSHGISRAPRYSGSCSLLLLFVYVTLTLSRQPSQTVRLKIRNTKCSPNPERISSLGLASSAFARHYLRNLGWFLFLALLRCFSSGGSPPYAIDSHMDAWTTSCGLLHSEISGSKLAYNSPLLIAVNHVLHRLPMPRHSLCALLCFTICSFGSSQNFRVQLFVVFFYPTFWLFTFMSLFLLTRSFHLHLLSLFCFQAALFSVLFQEQISTDDLFSSTDICPCKQDTSFFYTIIFFQKPSCNFEAFFFSKPKCFLLLTFHLEKWVVGTNGLEPSTSRLSGVRSNHLSYAPVSWWRWGESNSWPPACKAGALPAELHPHFRVSLGFSSFFLQTLFLLEYPQNWTMLSFYLLSLADRSFWTFVRAP